MTAILAGAFAVVIGTCLILFRKAISRSLDGLPFSSPSSPTASVAIGVVFASLGLLFLWSGLSSLK